MLQNKRAANKKIGEVFNGGGIGHFWFSTKVY